MKAALAGRVMGLFNSISAGIGSQANGFAGQVSSALGGGRAASALAKAGANMGASAAMGLVNNIVPAGVQKALNTGASMLGDIQAGNFDGAAMRLLDGGYLDKLIPGASGAASQLAYWGTPTPLMGGVTPKEAQQIHDALRGQGLAKKNLWMLEVSSQLMGKDASKAFNILATEVDFAPMTISGDKKKIGSASADCVQSSEPVELRVTTMDTKDGFIKRWFQRHYDAVVSEDGTVGHPYSYAIKIKIVHAFITDASNRGGYDVMGLYRPANLEISLSRREDALHEVQMTFTQLDTFMRP